MGGVTGGTAATLHRLSKKAGEGRDGTVYGVHSNANYFTHHATAISLATVTAAAEAIERGVNVNVKSHRSATRCLFCGSAQLGAAAGTDSATYVGS